jgi:hypothetical protein
MLFTSFYLFINNHQLLKDIKMFVFPIQADVVKLRLVDKIISKANNSMRQTRRPCSPAG